MTERWEQRRHDTERPVLDPSELYFAAGDMQGELENLNTVRLLDVGERPAGAVCFRTGEAPDLHIHDRGNEPAATLLRFCKEYPGRIMFAADTTGRREVLSETLSTFGIRPPEKPRHRS